MKIDVAKTKARANGERDYEEPDSMVARLNRAVVAADRQAIDTLLEQGADPSSQIEEGGKRQYSTDEMDTPLQSAIEMKGWGKHGDDVNIVKTLLDAHKRIERPALSRREWILGTNAGWVRREHYSRAPPFALCLQYGLLSEARLVLEEIRIALRGGTQEDPVGAAIRKEFNEGLTKHGSDLIMKVINGSANKGTEICIALLELTLGLIKEIDSVDMKVIMGLKSPSHMGGALALRNPNMITPLYALSCGLADVSIAQILVQHGGPELLSKATEPDSLAELYTETGSGFEGTWRNTTYAKWSEDNAWTPLIAASWYGRPNFVEFLVKQLGAREVKRKTYIHGLGPLDFVQHRIGQFKVLVEHNQGTRSGEKPESYEERHPKGTTVVKHPFRGETFRHGFRDKRSDEEMLADLTAVEKILTVPGESCVCNLL